LGRVRNGGLGWRAVRLLSVPCCALADIGKSDGCQTAGLAAHIGKAENPMSLSVSANSREKHQHLLQTQQ
jgi:hypothetical protein